jgi:hypothetical protein
VARTETGPCEQRARLCTRRANRMSDSSGQRPRHDDAGSVAEAGRECTEVPSLDDQAIRACPRCRSRHRISRFDYA